jgi:hypothetical protein
MGIRKKFITIILAVSIIPISISGFVIYNHVKDSLMKSLENQLETTAAIQESRINILFDRFSDDVKMIANRPNLKKQLEIYTKTRDEQSKNNLAAILNELMDTITVFHEISLVDTAGEVLYSTNESKTGKQLDKETFLARANNGCGVIDTIKGHDNLPDIWFSCPLSLDGKPQALPPGTGNRQGPGGDNEKQRHFIRQ